MRRRQFSSIVGGAALASLHGLPTFAEPSNGCGAPSAREDGWAISTSNDDKLIDAGALCRMADQLAASSNVHSVLVARSGKLVFERYFSGPAEVPGLFSGSRVKNVDFNADTLHDLKSASKSVASLAIGIAIDRGLIRSVNEPIFSFFPEYADLRSPEKDRIQLVHVLTMATGLDWVEATPATGENNDESRMHRAADPSRYVLGLASTTPPGQEFFYNTGALTLASAVVRKATGRPLDQYDGYLWWLGRARTNAGVVGWIGALGRGGQSIRIVPERNLVVAVMAGYYQDYSPQAFKLQFGVFRDVLRAIPPPG